MNRILSSTLSLLFATMSLAWVPSPSSIFTRTGLSSPSSTAIPMALDYNNPVVGEEFAAVQTLTYEEVEEELLESGVAGSPSMNEMDIKLMLVEVRLRKSGKMPGQEKKKQERPASFSSKFEEAVWTKPIFAELVEKTKSNADQNALNVCAEYLNDREMALSRYGKGYAEFIREIEAALNAVAEVTSPSISFSGFPMNMGEAGVKMTLEALGSVEDFECNESEDFPILSGNVTFEDVESAKKAIDQYNGMDMGMGQLLEINSV